MTDNEKWFSWRMRALTAESEVKRLRKALRDVGNMDIQCHASPRGICEAQNTALGALAPERERNPAGETDG